MNKKQKITLLNSFGVSLPAGLTEETVKDEWLNDELLKVAICKTIKIKNGSRVWLTVRNSAAQEFTSPTYDFEMNIHGEIGQDYWSDDGYTAEQFQTALKGFEGKRGVVNIHSEGGNIWDGFAIANMIEAHGNLDTRVLGLAASSADVIFQAGKVRHMSHTSMRMGHNPSSLFIAQGNAEQLRAQMDDYQQTIDRLDKHATTLAKMYSRVSGNSVDECRTMMDNQEFMDGDESVEKGFCDKIMDCDPPEDCDKLNLSAFKNLPPVIQNKFALPVQGKAKPQTKEDKVNKKQKIALLNSWGVSLPNGMTEETVTDTWLDDEIAKGKPKPVAAVVAATAGAVTNLDDHPVVKEMRIQNERMRREAVRNKVTRLASAEGGQRIPLNSIDSWVDAAMKEAEDAEGKNPVINRLESLEAKVPGFAPVSSIEIGDTFDVKEVGKLAVRCFAPRDAMFSNPALVRNHKHRIQLTNGSRQFGRVLKKQIDNVTNGIPDSTSCFSKDRAEAITMWMENALRPLMNADNATTYGAPGLAGGGVSITANIQRQVIMSEAMRAFKRRMLPLTAFSHTWNSVPLQGTDLIVVPYYPLFTTASSRFVTGNGYQFGNTDIAQDKNITVGGLGQAAKVAGQDRAYQALTYSAYVLRRQPWIDIQRLAVMRAEQLALDVLNDIVTAWVLKANFGNAVWTGLPANFDDTAVAFLAGVARKSDWPEAGRNLVIGTDYWVTLASSPYVKAFLNIGDTKTIREGKIGGLYGFEDTIENPRIPATADGNLAGWISFPSAVLCATSPILPAPGEMKVMVSYDVVVDPVESTQDEEETGGTGLAFEYKYWGEPWNSADREIIEVNYGSGLGELAALKRIVANGL
jgi:ATP-dependent protease ClpP protease subunit